MSSGYKKIVFSFYFMSFMYIPKGKVHISCEVLMDRKKTTSDQVFKDLPIHVYVMWEAFFVIFK